MNRIEGFKNGAFGLEKSSTDANRFYSILLDARSVKVATNMCDIAEKLVVGEKENAKIALEQLWALKKNLVVEKNGTIDLLINFYQEKIDILRAKEEHIKKVARDSRGLLEEKRKKDEEIASVKQQIGDCTREIRELNIKLEKLSIKEQELVLIETQLSKELNVNENEIVNGLYEIILAQQETTDRQQSGDTGADLPAPDAPLAKAFSDQTTSLDAVAPKPFPESAPESGHDTAHHRAEAAVPLSRVLAVEEEPPFPRSVVKTTAGRIIGEYYYAAGVPKEKRHYIFNSKFFARVATHNVQTCKTKYDQAVFFELLQMIQDAYKRVTADPKLHFEISTNEILNDKTLRQLWLDAKMRLYDEVERFCARLLAKIEAMGQNYRTLLREQMERCTTG
ncbi:MAG: hypothetical protein JW768_00330 [Chitinispirillaceae bacterium]|nr:hypothetical protein [Chitinispirillaceae bacterium]